MNKKISTPFTVEKAKQLNAGDRVLISGTIYTARDAAHKRLVKLLERGEKLPVDFKDSIIYYTGPTPPRPGEIIGSAGPTTSYRMDSFTPYLLDIGLRGMIGKGPRSEDVVQSIKKNKGVYFAAIGGAAALISKSVVESRVVAYEELGAEAIRMFKVVDMPVIVAVDSKGNDWYKLSRINYLTNDN